MGLVGAVGALAPDHHSLLGNEPSWICSPTALGVFPGFSRQGELSLHPLPVGQQSPSWHRARGSACPGCAAPGLQGTLALPVREIGGIGAAKLPEPVTKRRSPGPARR